MMKRLHWQDAQVALASLKARPGDRRTLLLITSLPFVNASILAQLVGLQGGASVYRSLDRLLHAGLVESIKPALYAEPPSRLYYLTDLGLATIALDHAVEPVIMARRWRLRHCDLLGLTPRLREILAGYELLAALALAGPGWPQLLHWERPWRRRYWFSTSKTPASVTLPAHAVLSWGEFAGSFLLVPDLGSFPLRLYRLTLHRLLGLRHQQDAEFPFLVVATTGEERAAAWERLLEEVRQSRWEAGWEAFVSTWEHLPADLERLEEIGAFDRPAAREAVGPVTVRPLRPRRPTSPLPRLVGNIESHSGSATAADGLGRLALTITPREHELLDLVSQHPFLTPARLAAVLGWTRRAVRQRLRRLMGLGLMWLVEQHEMSEESDMELVELTVPGLELVAAHRALTLPAAIRELGLAGGGPDEPIGSRAKLVRELTHTMGVDRLFVGLYEAAQRFAAEGSDDAVLAWQNASACSRRHLRPDGYGMYRRDGTLYGFFVEYDRGTMRRRGYAGKLDAYYDYGISRRYERDYCGYPTILLVTANNTTEEAIAHVARSAADRYGSPLPLLLTCTWRLEAHGNPHGLLGPIWREPGAAFGERRVWLPPIKHRRSAPKENMTTMQPGSVTVRTTGKAAR
ncbi:MAG TPA: replication-relaxation family protein [Chloroflexota bacterium]|nr:replication-relaxation family protein [Chloroflexota bacterium]